MFTEMMMSAGGGGANTLILSDDVQTAHGTGLVFYDTNYFEYVSGSFRNNYGEVTNITLKAKFSGKIAIMYTKGSVDGTITINGVAQELKNSNVKEVTINSNDTVKINMPLYYAACQIFYNWDNSTWQGTNID